jgi:cytochrome c oxidase subunit 1
MATHTEPVAPVPTAERRSRGRVIVSWLTTTDHKKIGHLYLITSFCFFLIGGVLAMAIRAELARPGLQLLSNEQYNQAFTMHGTIMLLLFATPTFAGFANAVMPLQIGSPDVAFPRLNMFSYWLFLFGGLIVLGLRPVPVGRSAGPSAAVTSAPTCGSWGSRWPGSAPSSARSTSSPPSSACAPPA